MKLIRWPLVVATSYVIYKYAIGKKAKGETVLAEPTEDPAAAKAQRVNAPRKSARPQRKPRKSP